MSLCPGHLIPQPNVSLHLPAIIYMELREIRLTHQNHTNCPRKNKEEYMSSYTKNHTKLECDEHFHELKIKPAKRIYTYHKENIIYRYVKDL